MFGYSPKSFEAVRANRQPLLTALAALGITELSFVTKAAVIQVMSVS